MQYQPAKTNNLENVGYACERNNAEAVFIAVQVGNEYTSSLSKEPKHLFRKRRICF